MTIEIEKTSDVWTVIHNRPEARNAMDPASADALVEAFEAFDKSDAKVAVLWGAGGSFRIRGSVANGGTNDYQLSPTPPIW